MKKTSFAPSRAASALAKPMKREDVTDLIVFRKMKLASPGRPLPRKSARARSGQLQPAWARCK